MDARGVSIILDRLLKNLTSTKSDSALNWGEETARLPNPIAIEAGLWEPSDPDEPSPDFLKFMETLSKKIGLDAVRVPQVLRSILLC